MARAFRLNGRPCKLMMAAYSDEEIESLVQERKLVPADWRKRIRLVQKPGHRERSLALVGEAGNEFRVIVRQNSVNRFDFSIILAVRAPSSNRIFRLRRHNGKSHEHSNRLEGTRFYGFHIHCATERYQELGAREDSYAEPTDRYADWQGALECLVADANIVVSPGSSSEQLSLFGE